MDEIKAIALMRSMLNKPIKEMKDDIESITKGATAHQQLVTDPDGNVKWEDRTHYVELIADMSEYTGEAINSSMIVWAVPSERVIGDNRIVMFDGVPYRCEIKQDPTQETSLYMGNAAIFDLGEDTGEPFLWRFFKAGGNRSSILTRDTVTTEHTVGCYKENTKLLDDDFMPTTVPVIQSAQVGQAVVVSAVDENGKPTEWEAVDMGAGGSGSADSNVLIVRPIIDEVNDRFIVDPSPDAIWEAKQQGKTIVFVSDANNNCPDMYWVGRMRFQGIVVDGDYWVVNETIINDDGTFTEDSYRYYIEQIID